ncbi:MAG: hypothetical protein ACJ8IK_13060 [Burkholderiaceae bacterium]
MYAALPARTVIDVYPGDGDWTRLFSDVVAPEGRVRGFLPAEVAHPHTPLMQAKGATAAAFNRTAYERLKSGGYYVIVDHSSPAGVGTSSAPALHRIDPATVRAEVEAAGFVLDAASSVLANQHDPHSVTVFDPSIKGETDRFAYRFVKPWPLAGPCVGGLRGFGRLHGARAVLQMLDEPAAGRTRRHGGWIYRLPGRGGPPGLGRRTS